MKKDRKVIPLAICLTVVAAATGCVETTYVPTGQLYPPRASDCQVEVFSSQLPAAEYEEIGVLEGEGSFWKADMEDLIPRLREEACRAGADALILHSAQRYASGEEGVDNMYAFATAIRWKREFQ